MFPFVWWWKTAIAGNKAVCQDGDQAFSGRVDDPAADDSGGITAEPHCHCQALLAAGMAFFKRAVHIKGDARQIAEIL